MQNAALDVLSPNNTRIRPDERGADSRDGCRVLPSWMKYINYMLVRACVRASNQTLQKRPEINVQKKKRFETYKQLTKQNTTLECTRGGPVMES